MRTPLPIGRKRLQKGTEVVEWTARLPVDSYIKLAELARQRKQELPITLAQIIEEHDKAFHVAP